MVQGKTEENSHTEAQKAQNKSFPLVLFVPLRLTLAADGDAERADVAAGVKTTQGNRVLTGSE